VATIDVGSWLKESVGILPPADDALLSCQLLVAHALGHPRSWVVAHPEFSLTDKQIESLQALREKLAQGMPLPYLLGHREFYGLDFIITPDVLIPRPETELLVSTALDWLKYHPNHPCIADVGTGSGCIAVTLAVKTTDVNITAIDISQPALAVARQNAELHHVQDKIDFLQADLLPADCPTFDLICANLPYIPTGKLALLPVSRFEPHLALDGGSNGLAVIRRLLGLSPSHLAPGGILLFEIENDQKEATLNLARSIYPAADIQVLPDLAGQPRLLSIQTQKGIQS
jgi:release factor glutamine methyltransferase